MSSPQPQAAAGSQAGTPTPARSGRAPAVQADLQAAWDGVQGRLLFPTKPRGHPYYISTPPWVQSSAGIRGLYLLCHTLNRLGHEAYITHEPNGKFRPPWTTPELDAPMLEWHHAQRHHEAGLTPIILYPETVTGNPLNAPVVARWVMNFPGLLGGEKTYAADEICFGYSRELAAAAGQPGRVLHLPTIDTRVFYPAAGGHERQGACFCASKYQTVHGGELFAITDGCFEITRQLADSLSSAEVAGLLRRSEVFYAYENTALATEAVLCGCPAVFLPNPHLTEVIGRKELGIEGYAWGAEPEEVGRARSTVAQGAINYLKTYDVFHEQLRAFIAITQQRAEVTPYANFVSVSSWPYKKNFPWSVFLPTNHTLGRVRKPWYRNQPQRVFKEIGRAVRQLKRLVAAGE